MKNSYPKSLISHDSDLEQLHKVLGISDAMGCCWKMEPTNFKYYEVTFGGYNICLINIMKF